MKHAQATHDALALVVDIGSGSVGIGLVHNTNNGEQTILWSHREYTTIKDSTSQPATKVIRTALLNAFLEFDAKGWQQIPEDISAHDLTSTYVLISAPWVYTVTKSVMYSQEHSFRLTDTLINELTQAAETETKETVANTPELADLSVLHCAPQAIIANGYHISAWHDAEARTLKLHLLTTLTHQTLFEMLQEMHEKTVPKTHLVISSHVDALHRTLQHRHTEMSEYCVVTVTSEATEIGIIRSGILEQVTSVPRGTYSLARDIAAEVKIPHEEGYTYLQKSYPENMKDKSVQSIIKVYQSDVAQTFQTTGDSLSIPKTIYLQTDRTVQEFFSHAIQESATECTGLAHSVHCLTNEVLGTSDVADTGLLLAAQYTMLE